MGEVFVISLQTLLEEHQASFLKPSSAAAFVYQDKEGVTHWSGSAGHVRRIEDLLSEENFKTLRTFFQGAFVFLGFHPTVDRGVTSYIRSGSLSSDSGENLLVLLTLDAPATSPVLLLDNSFRNWVAIDTAVHPSYTLIRTLFKDPVVLNFPGAIFFENILQNQNPVYVSISNSSDESAVRQQMRHLFALASKAFQVSVESQKNFLDIFALSLLKEHIDYERGHDVSFREWLLNAFRFIHARLGDIVSIVNLFK